VRLEADTAGGELHVRAGVIGDDGRAQSFRRLVARVAGPDGFSREVALEATGAGAYAASIPLSRPGTYVVLARDELSGEAVGTTGAVLGAGEELRPTGSDLALLSRIAELTGGKKRDTLAGIFGDRAARRFAYEDLGRTMVVLAALGLLLAVAARRLALPEALMALPGRVMAELRGRRAAPTPSPVRPVEATLGALLEARGRSARSRPVTETPALDDLPKALSVPPAPSVPAPTRATPPTSPAAPQTGGGEGAAVPPTGSLSTAEILLARRKKKGS
jgi:hypothetical protein